MSKFITQQETEVFIEEYLIFLRKSRSDNANESVEETLKRHEKTLQERAIELTGKPVKEENIYREVITGGEELEHRPEFVQVLNRLEKGNIKGVFIIDPQRLSRRGMYGAGDIINAFLHTDTHIVTPYRSFDLKNKYDKKFIEMELIQGAEFLDYTKEKMLNGRITSVKEGKYIGSTTPFGYDKEKIKDEKGYKLIPNPKEAEVVKMIFELCLDGIGTSNIANTLNKLKYESRTKSIWTPAMVRRILENETYYGMLVFNKRKEVTKLVNGKLQKSRPVAEDYILVKGLHEALVSEEEFKTARYNLRNSNHPRRPSNINEISNTLAGIVTCSCCGFKMTRRPHQKKVTKQPVSLHTLNKSELLTLLRSHKEKSGLSINQIKNLLGDVSRDQVATWFTPNINKFYVSQKFRDKWMELKKVINITTNKYDATLIEYVFEKTQPDTLMCPRTNCENVSSMLHLVEKRILKVLEDTLKEYNYFLDNYEEEIIKDSQNNLGHLKRVEDKIEILTKALKNARRNYNMEKISYEEYIEDKNEYENELNELNKTKEELLSSTEEDKLIKYKKAIPKIDDCLKNYDSFTIPQKNDVLKSLIEKIEYTKKENSRWNPNADFYLKITLKI